jgi:subfamily B ATP-binding cassette protein MsbA
MAVLAMILVSMLEAGQAYMVKPLLDEIFVKHDRVMLNLLPLALIALILAKGFFAYNYSYLLSKVGQYVIQTVRFKMYSHLQDLQISFYQKTPTGELMSRIMSDVALLQGALSNTLIGVIKDFFQVIFLIALIFYQNWKLALVAMIFFPGAYYPIVAFGRRHRKLNTKRQRVNASTTAMLHETIVGHRIVKAFGMEEQEIGRFDAMLTKLTQVTMRDMRIRSISRPLMEVMGGIGVGAIIWYGGNQVLNGTSTPGTFFSFIAAIVMIYDPVKGLTNVNSTIQSAFAAATRVFTMLDIKPEITDKPDATSLSRVNGQIELRDVSFSYNDEQTVLHGIDLTIQPCEVVALVGSSGAGKSTLADLVPRFFDVTKGQIRIDDHDIRDVTLASLRRQIAMVTQQTILFNDTVANNISYGEQQCPEQRIREAAIAAHALEFIEKLPQGFDTVIGESGLRLSGGQRQRLAIARALLKNAPILILDEATSALDTESEREVQKAIENLIQGRTTLVIAHRLSTIRNADRILVMQEGRIVEQGSHDTLYDANGVYRMLYDMQFREEQ